MPAPEGYDKLSVIGYSHKGEYNPGTTYNKYNNVYYNGNTYVALKDGLIGVEPSDDRENWMIMARGFAAEDASEIQATDTSNLVGGGAGKKTVLQTLLDKIAEIAVKAVMTDTFQTQLKKYLANNGTTNTEGFALDARYGKTLQDSIDTLNRNSITNENIASGSSQVDFTEESVPFSKKISYGKTFKNVPVVILTAVGQNPQNYHISVANITESGCDVCAAVDGKSTGYLAFYWVAVERGI